MIIVSIIITKVITLSLSLYLYLYLYTHIHIHTYGFSYICISISAIISANIVKKIHRHIHLTVTTIDHCYYCSPGFACQPRETSTANILQAQLLNTKFTCLDDALLDNAAACP